MRRTIATVTCRAMALVLVFGTSSCKKTEPDTAASSAASAGKGSCCPLAETGAADGLLEAKSGTTVVTLDVQGMHCDACVGLITAEVGKLTGVGEVRVSLEEKTAWVTVDDEDGPEPAAIIAAIESKGYKSKVADALTTQPATNPA